jgi:hypothetical protein
MSKKYRRRQTLKGGFLDSWGQTFSNWGNSIAQGASSVWNKTKKATGMDNTSSYSSSYTPSSVPTTSSYATSSYAAPTYSNTPSTAPPSSQYSYGGNRRKRTRRSKTMKKGGNFSANTPINTLASRAGEFRGGLTARVNDLVGGKRKRRTRRY